MNESIYPVFKFLVDLPVNINIPVNLWFWLLLVVAPLLVFRVKVERSIKSHIARVICAIGLTYILVNLSVHTKHAFDWEDYEQCRSESQHRIDSPEMHKECRHHLKPDGAQYVFALGLGWIPAGSYVGVWEALWRIRHRKKIKEMKKDYKGKWFSNFTIFLIFFPFIAYFTLWLIHLIG